MTRPYFCFLKYGHAARAHYTLLGACTSSPWNSRTHLVSAADMNGHNQIPVLVLHILEADIPQNPRIVYQHINPSEVIDGCFNDSFAILDTVVVGDGFAALRSDLLDNSIGSLTKLISG
jgi:hypothetical protein